MTCIFHDGRRFLKNWVYGHLPVYQSFHFLLVEWVPSSQFIVGMELLLICDLFEKASWHLTATFRNGTATIFVKVMRKHIVQAWYFLIWLLWRTMWLQLFVRAVLLVLLRKQSYQAFLIGPLSVILTQNPNRFFKSKHNSASLRLWCVFFFPCLHFILPWMNLSIYRTVHGPWTNNLFQLLIGVLRLVLTFIHRFLVATCGLVTAAVW